MARIQRYIVLAFKETLTNGAGRSYLESNSVLLYFLRALLFFHGGWFNAQFDGQLYPGLEIFIIQPLDQLKQCEDAETLPITARWATKGLAQLRCIDRRRDVGVAVENEQYVGIVNCRICYLSRWQNSSFCLIRCIFHLVAQSIEERWRHGRAGASSRGGHSRTDSSW